MTLSTLSFSPTPTTRRMTPARYALLAAAVVAISMSAPFIRFITAPALAVVFWRAAFSWPVIAATAVVRRQAWPWRSGVCSGFFLAIHWVAWVAAVQRTSIAAATTLMATSALWSAVLSRPILREALPRQLWYGLLLALGGVATVVFSSGDGSHDVWGDCLALVSAFAWVGYVFVGRRARQGFGLWGYTATMYLSGAACVLAVAMATDASVVGFDTTTWIALVSLALIPTLFGHCSMNYLLRYENPARLTLWTLPEPAIAAAIGFAWLGEVPSPQVLVGGTVTLLGVALALRPSAADAAEHERHSKDTTNIRSGGISKKTSAA